MHPAIALIAIILALILGATLLFCLFYGLVALITEAIEWLLWRGEWR